MDNNNARDRVTTVITTYYRNELLDDAIKSALDQTYPNIELIIVDGSGEKHASSVVDKYDDVTYIPQENQGPHSARMKGYMRSEGKYIQFLDDDDLHKSKKTAKQLEEMRNKDGVGVVYCGTIDSKNKILPEDRTKLRGNILSTALDNADLYPCVPSTMFIKSSLLSEIVNKNYIKSLSHVDGQALIFELAKLTKFDYVNEALTQRRHHADQITNNKKEYGNCMLSFVEQHKDVYDKYPDKQKKYCHRAYRYIGDGHLQESNFSLKAIKSYYKSLTYADSNQIDSLILLIFSIFGRPGVRLIKSLNRVFM